MKKNYKAVGLLLTLSVIMSGCGVKPIFEEKADPNDLVAVSEKDLEEDVYYVKDIADFYKTLEITGNASGTVNISSKDRLVWTGENDSLIPTMYSDGFIAYQTKKEVDMTSVNLERYESIGASIGIQGAEFDADGHIYVPKNKLIDDTSIAKVLATDKSIGNITIVKINDKEVTSEDLLPGGVIGGLEYGEIYKIDFYSGTFYKTMKVKADVNFYRSFEVYESTDISTTTNGYLTLSMPQGINSGYYVVNGAGMFRYYNVTKDNVTSDMNLNEPYYTNEADQISARSQQYVVSISQPLERIKFGVKYDPNTIDASEPVAAILTSPDGTSYKMYDDGVGELVTSIDYVIAGRWTVNIVPQTLKVEDVTTESLEQGDDAIKESYIYTVEEDTNKLVTVNYEGTGEIWGVVTYQDGTTYEFGKPKDNKLTVVIPYMAAGEYTIDVYHYADTAVAEPTISNNTEGLEEIQIVVESD